MDLLEKIKIRATNIETQIEMGNCSWVEIPPLLPSMLSEINEFEKIVNYPLPSLLKKMYIEISNGGFGPGYGFLPLFSNETDSIISLYKELSNLSFWKKSYIPLVNWGCDIYSCIDLNNPEANIFVFDGSNYNEEIEDSGILITSRNLDSFTEAWVNDIKVWNEMFP